MTGFLIAILSVALFAVGYQLGMHRGQDGMPRSTPPKGLTDSGPNAKAPWIHRPFATSIEMFHQSMPQWLNHPEPWPAFCEFVRVFLHECCGAAHVKLYKISDNGKDLTLLRDSNLLVATDRLCARRGIIGHVVTTGGSYVAGDFSQGDLLSTLNQEGDNRLAWCFPVQRESQRIGVVTATQLSNHQGELLNLAERLVNQFWLALADAQRVRQLEQFDPVCELFSRPAFLESADRALEESYRQGSPVAVAVLAFEGIRAINDSGRWEVADDLLREISKTLRAKVRGEDTLGRFDGSRFVVLLRRVDSELAALIVRQLSAQLGTLIGDQRRWGESIQVRCGLAGSGTAKPTLRVLLATALGHAQRAREQNRPIASDVVEPGLQESLA